MKKILLLLVPFLFSCSKDEQNQIIQQDFVLSDYLDINWESLPEYVAIDYPVHYSGPILQNTNQPLDNLTTNPGATLGRVLFYDKKLSLNNTVSCASCHHQDNGFTDAMIFSQGIQGFTPAHSMRLLNTVFYTGNQMFWDKRATSLEAQVTQPIQDHIEMGFDTANGGITALIQKMETIPYYPYLFEKVFGTPEITEAKIQKTLAQFIRSMISTESKFDSGAAAVFSPQQPNGNVGTPFPNFTALENQGKQLFLLPKPQGFGCAGCHQPPTMALIANSLSNGLDQGETKIFKSPALKNIASGPYMHDGRLTTIDDVIEHYNSGIQNGPALDNRLRGLGGVPQQLNMTNLQKEQLKAFLLTLTDNTITNNPKFSNPHLVP